MTLMRKDFKDFGTIVNAQLEANMWLETEKVAVINVETLMMSRSTGQGSSGMTEVGIRVWYMKP